MCGNHAHHEHSHINLPVSMVTRRSALRIGVVGIGAALLAACGKSNSGATAELETTALGTTTVTSDSVATLQGFESFADSVKVVNNGNLWLIESNGLPAHNMMVGITSWQQQVPTSQQYIGTTGWQSPTNPVAAETPVSAKTQLYRGAIALAVNGVPIFNALNNRGDDAFLVGELDEWGGHAGRADDYHYHIAPLHLQEIVGSQNPIAYALDGYAIYGETEPDGSAVGALDEFNGHEMPDGSYHYHGTRTYPYINGGLRGNVSVIEDQIDPQPTTRPFRESLEPMAGATITSFETLAPGSYKLGYVIQESSGNNKTGQVAYIVTDSSVVFTFTNIDGSITTETYSRPS
jgi:hypothetical protein